MFKFGKDSTRAHVESVAYHFYINEAIIEPDDYVDLIDCLYQSRPSDTIYLHLNTNGGSLDITMQIINAINASDATVVGVADGQVASAGSLILFSCPNIAIQDFSYVMLHDGSEGAGGKVNENLKQALFTAKLLHKIAHKTYEPFFTPEEIDTVLGGTDMWLSSEEVKERVTNSVAQLLEDNEEKEKGEDIAEEQVP